MKLTKLSKILLIVRNKELFYYSSFSVSNSSSFTSSPCSFIVFTIEDIFCVTQDVSLVDSVLISSSHSFTFNPCYSIESNTEEIF